jgi:curved DNA-binding protein CbpA
MPRDLYSELGVGRGATRVDVKKAYRRRVKTAHPDAGGDPAAFRRLQLAYDVLSDDAQRKRYDETGQEEAPSDKAVQEAAQAVISAVAQTDDVDHDDVLRHARAVVSAAMAQVRRQREQCGAVEIKFRRAAGRVSRRGGGDNVLSMVLERQAEEMAKQAAAASGEVERLSRVQAVLGEYDYRVDGRRDGWQSAAFTPLVFRMTTG